MKYLFPFLLAIVSIYIYACANQGTPTGGPRDTIPPLLIESTPENKSINYHSNEFQFAFSEKINADKLKNQLLITPHIENKFTVKVKKNELYLKFDGDFNDSTTYTLNFSDGVVDITEKNPAINLTFAFSTGTYIDSIYVNGRINSLYTNKPQQEVLVGLYHITDSLDLFKDKPRYFAKTNEQGQFLIENIKNDFYKILAFKDENRNLSLDPATEPHGFLSDSLDLTSSQDSVIFPIQFINASAFQSIRSKTTGRYFDMQYNKSILSYELNKLHPSDTLPVPSNNLIKEDKILRFYPHESFEYDYDSLGLIITARDSLSNTLIDTAFVKFAESSRKPDAFSFNIEPTSGSYIDPLVSHYYTFSKPIKSFNKDSIKIGYDTLKYQEIPDSSIQWNPNHTALSFETLLDKKFLKQQIDTLLEIYGDSTKTDSVSLSKLKYYSQVKTNSISLSFPKGTFISVDNDSTESISNSYTFKSLDQMGSVSGNISTSYNSFSLQLVDTKYNVIYETSNSSTFHFPYVKPGKYTFRVMIDTDEDGVWSYGNILDDQTPEPIYFYPEIFDVRPNWQLENIQITF